MATPGSTGATPSSLCSAFNAARGGLYVGSHGAAGLQTFIIINGEAGILTAHANGHYSGQPEAAVKAFVQTNHC